MFFKSDLSKKKNSDLSWVKGIGTAQITNSCWSLKTKQPHIYMRMACPVGKMKLLGVRETEE